MRHAKFAIPVVVLVAMLVVLAVPPACRCGEPPITGGTGGGDGTGGGSGGGSAGAGGGGGGSAGGCIVDLDALAIASVTQPAHGVAEIVDGQRVAYTPAPDFHGSDGF
ncbi:MAG: Ig-like domain-containing protein, partial [Panacagrimonas sp.]